ncbi:TetR/AcrR family transcriptional regulator [Microbacterium sp. MYb66]|uniref:TetR/AcrR family transcriptional regulator n=1 Tax=Microbacterium sp. MYb66 TaxID=1848692 RepID=UPI000CFF25A4|nr:hypothetical protein [Microbacterium sp. MYb66]PRA79200.1 hypothetical protein CQ045_15630 [Microbacterium sp. MYb66]
MDARARRSRERLRDAVLNLAGRTPVVDISVSAICSAAGVTRDTFYRHAEGPVQLLADALSAEIDEAMEILPQTDAIGDGERALLEHVQRRASIYRGAMHPLLAAPIRSNLEESIRSGLVLWADLHPQIVPAAFEDPSAMRIAVAYAAAGTVGAIEEWLRSDDDDIERAVRLILAASPEWWLR